MQVRIIATSAQQKSPVALLLKRELIQKLKVTNTQMNAYLQDGMPHFLIGNESRILESEIRTWLKTYKPSQERLESEFRDKKGRTLEEYVTEEIIVETLRITKEKLVGLCKKEMPFERVGERISSTFRIFWIIIGRVQQQERKRHHPKVLRTQRRTRSRLKTPKNHS